VAAPKTGLRAVAPGETADRKPPTTVSVAVETGTQRDQLVAMRARIAKAIDEPNIRGADLAALSRRLLEIGREVDAIDGAAKQEADDGDEAADEAFDASAV
jgi:hypothetical protein